MIVHFEEDNGQGFLQWKIETVSGHRALRYAVKMITLIVCLIALAGCEFPAGGDGGGWDAVSESINNDNPEPMETSAIAEVTAVDENVVIEVEVDGGHVFEIDWEPDIAVGDVVEIGITLKELDDLWNVVAVELIEKIF